jgi:hypothetical protein
MKVRDDRRVETAVVATVTVLGIAASAIGLALLAASWEAPAPDSWGFRGFTIVFATAYGGVGAILASRRPENRVGWILLAAGTCSAVQLLVEEYAIFGVVDRTVPLPGAAFAGWVESWIWLVGVVLIVVITLLLFPNGKFVSPRWRIVAWLAAADLVVGVAGLAFAAGPLNNAPFALNPYPVLGEPGHYLFYASFAGVVLLATSAAASLVVRYRRSAGAGQQQLKWLALEAVLISIAIVIVGLAQAFAPTFKPVQVLFIVVLALMPVAIGVAILRYRLYDIDVLINRALVYAATTAAIALTFFGGIVVLQAGLRPLTGGNEVAVAASTLVCFALFQPIRRRMQSTVDRRFYRSRYDAARTLDRFTSELAGEVDLGAVRASLIEAVGETVQPTHASVWLR